MGFRLEYDRAERVWSDEWHQWPCFLGDGRPAFKLSDLLLDLAHFSILFPD